VREGRRAKITCDSESPVSWKFSGSDIAFPHTMQLRSTLVFKKVAVKNHGLYTCKGTTSLGIEFLAVSQLVVVG